MGAHEGFHDEETDARGFDARLLRRLLPFGRPHRRLLLLGVLALFGLTAAEFAGPWLLRLAIDGPIRRRDAHAFLPYALGFAAVALGAGFFRWAEGIAMNRAGQGVIRDLRLALFAHLQRLSLAFYDRNAVGRLVTRVTSDVENLAELFTSGVVLVLYDATKVLGAAALLFWIDARLAAGVLAASPLLLGVSLWFRPRWRDSYREVRRTIGRLNAYLQEAIGGIRVVQMFGREKKVERRFAALAGDYLGANLRSVFYFALFFPLVDFAVTLIWGGTLLTGGRGVVRNALSFGAFFQFWQCLQIFFGPILEFGEKWNVLQSAMASAERIVRILDTPPGVLPPPVPKSPDRSAGGIEVRGVTFSYDGSRPVLRGVSFSVRPGQTVAIVGATGAGKSTVLSLLLRFYDPQEGTILVDGVDLREWDPSELRSRIGVVLQDAFLFAGTVRENLALGRPAASEERILAAARAVGADEVLARRPGGLDAPVAERGVTFSSGERQLLALARALAGDPSIVVLDEATANVDTETERRIQQGIAELLRGRTSLVVAHRLSTIRESHRILVFHHGAIRESGTHRELLALGGIYARLYRLQFGAAV
ncbi:MAG TPA: ABC transporter ATP-binding protein [Planctomycetota bacterium]|jgi:ABC-type multidrug transport system fused ATPase/permease subunit|nr:ABC transporter ATP-binding protein [Planctomycetota bacterium]